MIMIRADSFGYLKLHPVSGASALGSVMVADPSLIELTH
jgi:hypothetical protein